MKTNIIKLVAGLAWAGVAIANATPANALAYTMQDGAFANCSANCNPNLIEFTCQLTYYEQNIKLVDHGCSSQACNSETGTVQVDFPYSTGRKDASLTMTCDVFNVYALGSCAC